MDARELIDKFGGYAVLAGILSKESGSEVKVNTVRMWKHRNIIPWKWRAKMYAIAKRHGIDMPELLKG